ncbi:hypothetical protein N0V82_005938 [Gnomoniopsis sp. IMI 355080]|nr:hypothetical protein N0V82_005938 [Gnomoniopsis sp. IMI 355080]
MVTSLDLASDESRRNFRLVEATVCIKYARFDGYDAEKLAMEELELVKPVALSKCPSDTDVPVSADRFLLEQCQRFGDAQDEPVPGAFGLPVPKGTLSAPGLRPSPEHKEMLDKLRKEPVEKKRELDTGGTSMPCEPVRQSQRSDSMPSSRAPKSGEGLTDGRDRSMGLEYSSYSQEVMKDHVAFRNKAEEVKVKDQEEATAAGFETVADWHKAQGKEMDALAFYKWKCKMLQDTITSSVSKLMEHNDQTLSPKVQRTLATKAGSSLGNKKLGREIKGSKELLANAIDEQKHFLDEIKRDFLSLLENVKCTENRQEAFDEIAMSRKSGARNVRIKVMPSIDFIAYCA